LNLQPPTSNHQKKKKKVGPFPPSHTDFQTDFGGANTTRPVVSQKFRRPK
jgi:hypothetical protein